MKRILFTCDSITDMYRSREDGENRGIGYPTLIAGCMGLDRPGEFAYLNTGVSGNRVIDLLARVKCDMINLKPDYLSILVGVNDVWHEIDFGCNNGVSAERYALYYGLLLDEIKEALPQVQIVILEPFLLKASATEEKWDYFRAEVELRAAAARRIAAQKGAIFVPLQVEFDRMLEFAPADYWLYDGVHPTAMGHEVIKRKWLKAFAILEQVI